jgi:hypothetical protein
MVLLRILRRLCEEKAIPLGLQYISSVLNIWADKLSRSRISSDWALTPSSLAKIRNHLPHHHNITIHTQVFARRDTSRSRASATSSLPPAREARPSWKNTAATGRPNAMAGRDGTHPRNPHAGTRRTRPSASTSRPVGRRRRRPRRAGATLAPAFHAGRRHYNIAGGFCVASRATHGESTILRELSVDGAPSRLQSTAPGDVYRQAGYSAGLTCFGRSREGVMGEVMRVTKRIRAFSYRCQNERRYSTLQTVYSSRDRRSQNRQETSYVHVSLQVSL